MLGGLEFAAFPGRKRKTDVWSPLSTENLRIWRLGHPTCSPTRKTDSSDSTVLSAFCTKNGAGRSGDISGDISGDKLGGLTDSGDKAVTSGDMLGGLEFAAFPGRKRKTDVWSRFSAENERTWRLGHPTCSPTRKTDSSNSTVLSAFCTKNRSRMER